MKKRSKVKKRTFNAILIIELFVIIGILFVAVSDICLNCFGARTIICIVVLICAGVIIPIVVRPLLKMAYQRIEDFDNSTEYVKQHLLEEHWTEVIPIKDEPQHENFLTKELCKRAKFYAIIMSDGTVCISLQFNGEEDMIYYGGMQASNFTNYFKVLGL